MITQYKFLDLKFLTVQRIKYEQIILEFMNLCWRIFENREAAVLHVYPSYQTSDWVSHVPLKNIFILPRKSYAEVN